MPYIDFVNGNSHEEMDKLSKQLFGENIDDDSCSGCIYDILPLTYEEYNAVMHNCPFCKRFTSGETSPIFKDLYQKEENDNV